MSPINPFRILMSWDAVVNTRLGYVLNVMLEQVLQNSVLNNIGFHPPAG